MELSSLAKNLSALRRANGLSQERAAEAVGVTRQALAKWEAGETTPDILHSDKLAELYGVSLDDLLHYEQKPGGFPPPPRGKHVFGVVQMGERGQVVIPKRARELLAVHFEKVGRKDPGGHAAVHHGCWVKFREFLEATDRLSQLEESSHKE